MANREALAVIRNARAGALGAQLELGKLYLHGSGGLPRSLPTALHWLERAAGQGAVEACLLMAAHLPLALARTEGTRWLPWFATAARHDPARFEGVFAQLQSACGARPEPARAHARPGAPRSAPPVASAPPAPPAPGAEYAQAERLWAAGEPDAFLAHALPLARALLWQAGSLHAGALDLDAARLLVRCAQVMSARAGADQDEVTRLIDTAAAAGDRDAQLELGLRLARMRIDGSRSALPGPANFKKALRWLELAGGQGLAVAWFALSRIYGKAEFSQRNIHEAHAYLERAAAMGYRDAQLECGLAAWRARRERAHSDVRAVYWLQLAAAQGCGQAAEMLERIAPPAHPQPDTPVVPVVPAGVRVPPLLAARLDLAAAFGLSRAETLLLEVGQADHGHCLVVDIRASFGRSKRRLVPVATERQRQVLDRAARAFADIDASVQGPEGNYRQRLYRLRSLLGAGAPADAALC